MSGEGAFYALQRFCQLALIGTTCVLGIAACVGSSIDTLSSSELPNIILVIADDLGYSDIAPFGGEIPTPSLDQLAANGTIFTNFHTSPSCSPTRAMLFTGVDHHLAGLGTLAEIMSPEQRGHPGYEGFLNDRVVSIATVLKDVGYRTLFSGKWHLGSKPSRLPTSRGFDRGFSLLEGGGNHFDTRGYGAKYAVVRYKQDGKDVTLPEDHYSSVTIADKLIDFIDEPTAPAAPIFGVLSFTAPHWPLQAPDEHIERHESKYLIGWDAIRANRLSRLKDLGLVSGDTDLPPRSTNVEPWSALNRDDQRRNARLMGIYAAMTEILDENLGRVLNELKSSGKLRNTVVIFLSDNGPEARDITGYPFYASWLRENFETQDPTGNADSFLFAGQGWGQVSATPNRDAKGSLAEGGIRTPLIITDFRNPNPSRPIVKSFTTVLDIFPTILDFVGLEEYSANLDERNVHAPTGQSMWPAINGEPTPVHLDSETIGFEYNGQAAMVRGNWKALRTTSATDGPKWALYDLDADQTELRDLATQHPSLLLELVAAHNQYKKDVGVRPRSQADVQD